MIIASRLALLLALLLAQARASADENDIRHKRGDGKNNDGAAYLGDQKTQQQLTPDMMQHFSQASMYFSTGNIPMGQMEQMKGELLKQQIDENKRSADQNRKNERKLTEEDGPPMQQTKGDPSRVITVDKERLGGQGGTGGGTSDVGSSLSAIVPKAGAAEADAPSVPQNPEIVQREKLPPEPYLSPQAAALLRPGGAQTTVTSSGPAGTADAPSPDERAASPLPAGRTEEAASSVGASDWRKDLEVAAQGTAGSGADALAAGEGSASFRLLGTLPAPPKARGAQKAEDGDPFASIGKAPAVKETRRTRRPLADR